MISRISLRQLEYFVACGETGTITGAAERIHVSPPSISTAIVHIETELGVRLFVRHHAQGLSLTPLGHQLLGEAKQILEKMGNLYTLASEAVNEVRGPLRVGCFEVLAPTLTPELVYGFGRAFPGVNLHPVEANHEALMDKLKNGDLDVVITYDLHLPDDIRFEPLARLPPYVIVGESHPFAAATALTLEELAPHPMVLLDLPYSREYFLSMFIKAGLTPNIGARSGLQEVVRTLVANNFGYSFANVRSRVHLSQDGKRLIRIRLAGDVRPMRIGVATVAGSAQTQVVSAFIQRCQAFISDHYIAGMSAASFFDPHTKKPHSAPFDTR